MTYFLLVLIIIQAHSCQHPDGQSVIRHFIKIGSRITFPRNEFSFIYYKTGKNPVLYVVSLINRILGNPVISFSNETNIHHFFIKKNKMYLFFKI